MIIRLAHKQDVSAIEDLMLSYGKFTITPKHINHRDISVVAMVGDKCIGFIWAGLMAGNSIAYIDKFCVSNEYSHKGVGKHLAIKAIQEGCKRGVKKVFGIIRHDEYHDKSAMNALKSAIGADPVDYTMVHADLNFMVSELKTLSQGE